MFRMQLDGANVVWRESCMEELSGKADTLVRTASDAETAAAGAVQATTASGSPPIGQATSKAPSEQKNGPGHPIAKAVSGLVYRLRDFEDCASEFVPVAEKMRPDSLRKLIKEIQDFVALLAKNAPDEGKKVLLLKRALEWTHKVKRVVHANPERVLRESLFIGMFGAFDAFTGELLRALFERKPALFGGLKRQIDVAAIMESETLQDLKQSLIEEEIESFRRESYCDQFAKLEGLFGLKLRSLSRWSDFVERSQRRNLLTHCDGMVNDQYRKACRAVGVGCNEEIGVRLEISSECLKDTVELLMEVGIKLGQTLWRKVLPDELEAADNSLNSEIYDCLTDESWNRASVLAEFAIGQPQFASDVIKKVVTVNYVIAAKFGGRPEKARELLAALDWSGATADFRLAKAVLEDRFEDACAIMLQVGKHAEYFKEHTYHVFPLFRVFRLQQCFLDTYEKVFGRPFSEKVHETMDEAKIELEVKAEQDSQSVQAKAESARAVQTD